MRSSRIVRLTTALALSLGVAACGSSTTSPKLQISATAGRAASTVTTSKPQDKGTDKPADQQASGAAKSADPAKITKANYEKINIGMSEKEVCDVLGAPSKVQPSGDGMGQVCTWEVGKKVITATFRADRLTRVSEANINDDK